MLPILMSRTQARPEWLRSLSGICWACGLAGRARCAGSPEYRNRPKLAQAVESHRWPARRKAPSCSVAESVPARSTGLADQRAHPCHAAGAPPRARAGGVDGLVGELESAESTRNALPGGTDRLVRIHVHRLMNQRGRGAWQQAEIERANHVRPGKCRVQRSRPQSRSPCQCTSPPHNVRLQSQSVRAANAGPGCRPR